MSVTPLECSQCTFDEETECLLESSFLAATGVQNTSCCVPANGTATREPLATHIETAADTDVMTMRNAVRIPCALRSAARRTMLDILNQLQGQEQTTVFSEFVDTQKRHISSGDIERKCGEIETNNDLNKNLGVSAISLPSNKETRKADMSRSLRHLLPSKQKPFVESLEQRQQQQEYNDEQSITEDSISDIDDNKNDLDFRGVMPSLQSNINPPHKRCLWAFSEESAKNKSENVAHQHHWMRLFDCSDQFGCEELLPADVCTTAPQKTKRTSFGRISTLPVRQSGGSLQSFCDGNEGEMQRKTGSSISLATLLDNAEALDDAVRVQPAKTAPVFRGSGEGQLSLTDALAADEEEDIHLLPRHSFAHSCFYVNQQATGIGTSMSTAFAALCGAGRRSSGRSRANVAPRQLSDNITAARVIAYITRSFENWSPVAAAIPCVDAEECDSGTTHSRAESLETSGVHLKLLVKKVENAFSLYFLRCELVWKHTQVSDELVSGSNTTAVALSTSVEDDGKYKTMTLEQKDTNSCFLWTIVLTATAFRCVPIIVGEHVYLAKPFFCYPVIRTIVSSLNVISDASLRQLRNSNIRQRRSRDENLLCTQEGNRTESRGRCGEETVMNTATPGRVSRSSASLCTVSPFKAYDPFVNPPVNLFCGGVAGTTLTESLNTPLQPPQQSSASAPKTIKPGTATETHVHGRGTLLLTSCDPIGEHFPRGPGDEWDVPLEVLFALCPPRRHAHASLSTPPAGAEVKVGVRARSGVTGIQSVSPQRIKKSQSSSISSVPSVDDEEAFLTLL